MAEVRTSKAKKTALQRILLILTIPPSLDHDWFKVMIKFIGNPILGTVFFSDIYFVQNEPIERKTLLHETLNSLSTLTEVRYQSFKEPSKHVETVQLTPPFSFGVWGREDGTE
jgi:hypothetical protein